MLLIWSDNKQVRHMFDEIDYILEAQNAERFASLYASSKFRAVSFNLFFFSSSICIIRSFLTLVMFYYFWPKFSWHEHYLGVCWF